MKALSRLFGLLLLGLLTGLLLLTVSSCGTSRTGERARPGAAEAIGGNGGGAGETGAAAAPGSRTVMRLNAAGTAEFRTPQAQLTTALARQFNDGTVIDRVLVRAAPGPKTSRPTYYLIGMGLREGSFRAVALPLTGSDDGTFYLRPAAHCFVLTSAGCPSCYFNFEDGYIVGTTCDDNSGGSSCTLRELPGNQVFGIQRPATTAVPRP